jgi:hypothetical protein
MSRKLKVASRQWAKRIGQGGLRDVLQTNGEPGMRLVLCTALSKGEKFWRSGCLQSCGLVRQSERPWTNHNDGSAGHALSFAEAPSFPLSATYSVHLEFWRVLNHDRPLSGP